MFSRSLYQLRNLSRSSGFSVQNSTNDFNRSVLSAFRPLLQNRSNANNAQPDASASSLNQSEQAKFAAIAESWWDAEGPFKPLHAMNPTRLTFIRSTLCRHFGKDPFSARPFEGLKFVDVGCGGGILSEPLARMGALVTGIDAVYKNIKIARLRADLDPVVSSIKYRCTTAENLVAEQKQFDAVIALELPKDTHQWSNFVTPEELVLILRRASISVEEMAGFLYDPLTGQWSLTDDSGVNFIAFGIKKQQIVSSSAIICSFAIFV